MTANGPPLILPGKMIGIIGGGQLGRMLILAAARLGYRSCVLCPDPGAPAVQVATQHVAGDYTDVEAITAFTDCIEVATYEFENIPAETVAQIARTKPIAPAVKALEVAQDRLIEKQFIQNLGIEVAPFQDIASLPDLKQALETIGAPGIIKTRRFGYDGKGQRAVKPDQSIEDIWADFDGIPAIYEGFVDFACEISVMVVRDHSGHTVTYPPGINEHRNHILYRTTVPAKIDATTADVAATAAQKVAEALSYVGTLGVEMFVRADGSLVVNEIAPRVHNSGHWTLEGAQTDQFENHIRAITGLPLGDTRLLGPTQMMNLIGEDVCSLDAYLSDPSATLHLYGKDEPRAGRKMGHVTRRLKWPQA
ncbi:MAG: 5-(carboxyamino)imidazole ribonucleotide synthase [Pseudomonadota bacterium]